MSRSQKFMKMQKRLVNPRRHTIGYKVSGKWRSRQEVFELAKEGRIKGVRACEGFSGNFIQAVPGLGKNLYDLETWVEYQK